MVMVLIIKIWRPFMFSRIIVLTTLLTSFSSWSYTKGKTYKITILHTNDHHGRFWNNQDGEYGMAARATLIKELRQDVKDKGGVSLLLSAGDINTGVPHSDLQYAEPDFKGMSLLGYDAMAVGNHEFDNPLEKLFQQQRWSNFPFLSANIYYKDSNKRPFAPSHNWNFDDLKVTVFGLTTEDTPLKTNATNTASLNFVPTVEEARKLVPKLRKETDILIALTHTGHYVDANHGANAPGDVTLAREVSGIDLIVGGHTQKPLFNADVQNNTIIVQAYEWGKYVGRVDLEFLDGKVTLKNYELIPVNLKSSKTKIPEDRRIKAFLQTYQDQGNTLIKEMNKGLNQDSVNLGNAEVEFIGRREVVRYQETNLGNLVSTAYRAELGTDIGIMNAGGMRDTLNPGAIKFETILTILPFKGQIVVAKLKGDKLKEYLEQAVFELLPGSGSFPHISGVTATADREAKKLNDLKINGKALDLSKTYTIALPEFIAKGGDKYIALDYEMKDALDAIIVKNFLAKKKGLKAHDFAPTQYIKNRP